MTRPAGVPELTGPSFVTALDLSEGRSAREVPAGDRPLLLVVATLCGEVLGMFEAASPTTVDTLTTQAERTLGERLALASAFHGHGVGDKQECRVERERDEANLTGPAVSVVLCTRDRPDDLARCLESFTAVRHQQWELLVVDNAPSDDATKVVVEKFMGELPIRYAREDAPGLSCARNKGIELASFPIIAFVDDDERIAPEWVSEVSGEFLRNPQLGAVSGLVLPAELETWPQVMFERSGGHSKGRGFTRAVFDAAYLRDVQSPYAPTPPFGVGANMAFRVEALRHIGGFDEALGAGTPTGGCEDTAAFSEVLLAGWEMSYAPRAVTWHYHRRDEAALHRQLRGYGVGLGAFYASLVRRSPRRVFDMARLGPRIALGYLRGGGGDGGAISGSPWRTVWNMASGPLTYVRARRRCR